MSSSTETDWPNILKRFTDVIGNKRYGELTEKMAELGQAMIPKYQNTDLQAYGTLLTLCLHSPHQTFGLDICWDWDKRMYESYEVEIESSAGKTSDETFYPSVADVLSYIEQYTREGA